MTSDVEIWDGDLLAQTLPPICVITGEATNGTRQVRFVTTPRWIILLILAGVVPFIVAWALAQPGRGVGHGGTQRRRRR